jgi:hypothetical protein
MNDRMRTHAIENVPIKYSFPQQDIVTLLCFNQTSGKRLHKQRQSWNYYKEKQKLTFPPSCISKQVMGAAQSSPPHHQACKNQAVGSQISPAAEFLQKAAPCYSRPAISQIQAIGAVRTSLPHDITPPNQTIESGTSTTVQFPQRAPQPPAILVIAI